MLSFQNVEKDCCVGIGQQMQMTTNNSATKFFNRNVTQNEQNAHEWVYAKNYNFFVAKQA